MLPSKTSYTQYPNDLIVIGHSSAPGYGDPIKRDSEMVAEDVRKEFVSEEAAHEIYGVILDVDGDDVSVRKVATKEHREMIRNECIDGSTAPDDADEYGDLDADHVIHTYLAVDTDTGTAACHECGQGLCDATENYKDHCGVDRRPVTEAGRFFEDLDYIKDVEDIEFRQFIGPSCGVLFDFEVALADQPFLHDIEVDVGSAADLH